MTITKTAPTGYVSFDKRTPFQKEWAKSKGLLATLKFVGKYAAIALGCGIVLAAISPGLILYGLGCLGDKASDKAAEMWNKRFPSNPSVPKPEFSGSPTYRDIGDKRAQALAKFEHS